MALLVLSALCLLLPFQAAVVPTIPDLSLIQRRVINQHQGGLVPNVAFGHEQLAEIRALAHAVTSGEVKLDDVTRASLAGMWKAMERITENTTLQTHREDQAEVNRSIATIADCGLRMKVAFAEPEGIDAKSADVDAGRLSHSSCRTSLAAGIGTDCAQLNRFKATLSAPNLTLDRDSPHQYILAHLAWAEEANRTYVTLGDGCKNETVQLRSMQQDCTLRQIAFEGAFCEYHAALTSTCSTYSDCRSRMLQTHSEIIASVQASEASRKVEFTSAKTVQCYITLLNTTDHAAQQAQLPGCATLNVSTSHLDMTYPAEPRAETCDQTPVASRPCDATWMTAEYANKSWSNSAPAAECTPCPGAGSTEAPNATASTSIAPPVTTAAPASTTPVPNATASTSLAPATTAAPASTTPAPNATASTSASPPATTAAPASTIPAGPQPRWSLATETSSFPVVMGDSEALGVRDHSFTMMAEVYRNSQATRDAIFGSAEFSGETRHGFVLYTYSGGTAYELWTHNNGCNPPGNGWLTGLIGEWYTVAVVYDLPTTTLSVYVNGNLVNSCTNFQSYLGTGDLKLGVGNNNEHPWDGSIRAAYVFAEALTKEQMAAVFQSQ